MTILTLINFNVIKFNRYHDNINFIATEVNVCAHLILKGEDFYTDLQAKNYVMVKKLNRHLFYFPF